MLKAKIDKKLVLAGLIVTSAALAACSGGGGGGGTPPVSSPTVTPTHATSAPVATPTATATPTSAPSVATASGTVVDFDSNSGLSGVTVAIASYSSTAAPVAVATTGPSGAFTFTASPGSYLIEIGSNSATDTRATYHNKVTLVAGANAITQGVPSPEPDVTLAPSQVSGNFRLAELNSNEQDCVSGANQGRAQDSLVALIPDEQLEEQARASVAGEIIQQTDTPSQPANSYGAIGENGFTTSSGFSSCDSWTGPTYSYVSGNPPYPYSTNASNIYYGASYGGSGNYGAQNWAVDLRT